MMVYVVSHRAQLNGTISMFQKSSFVDQNGPLVQRPLSALRCKGMMHVYMCLGFMQNHHPHMCTARLVTQFCEYTDTFFLCQWVMVFSPSRPWLSFSPSLSLHLCVISFSTSVASSSSSFSLQCTRTVVKHWPESQVLRRLRGSGLTDRWISPQAPATGDCSRSFPFPLRPLWIKDSWLLLQ